MIERAYTARMRTLGVVSSAFLLAMLPACAQRGAGVGQAAGTPTAAAHGGFSTHPAGAAGLAPGARINGVGSFGAVPSGQRNLFPPPGITSTRPVYYSNGVRRYGDNGTRGAGLRGGYGLGGYGAGGYGIVGVPYAFGGYGGDLGFAYQNSDAFDPLDPNNGPTNLSQGTAQDAFLTGQPLAPVPSQQSQAAAAGTRLAPGSESYAETSEAEETGPTMERPSAPPARRLAPVAVPPVAAPLPEEDAVTIVFKDGRPSEQIHNYALTRSTLLITGAHVRSIPVDQIDLVATAKANEKSGVDFQLPTK